MLNSATISSRVVVAFLDELSSCHGNLNFDLDIIQGIVKGWVEAGDAESILALANSLEDIAKELKRNV